MILTMPPPRPRGPAYGWGISLVAHALLVAWLLHAPAPRFEAGPAPERIDFVLVVPQPAAPSPVVKQAAAPAPPAAAPARTPRAAGSAARPAAVRPATQSAAAPATTGIADPTPDSAAPAAAETPPAETVPVEAAPAFDMAAARSTARAAAREGSPGLVLRPRPPPTLDPGREIRQEQLQRDLERARRSDCKSAYSGLGLFAVIPLVKDAVTGTGCKW